MSTKRNTLAGMIGAVSLLVLTTAGAQAQLSSTLSYCQSGRVVAVGAGYAYPHKYGNMELFTIVPAQRTVTLQCDEAPSRDLGFPSSNPALILPPVDTSARAFLIPARPDKDGIYAAALTALVDGKKVEYYLSSTAESVRWRAASPPYRQSWIRLLHIKSEPISDQ